MALTIESYREDNAYDRCETEVDGVALPVSEGEIDNIIKVGNDTIDRQPQLECELSWGLHATMDGTGKASEVLSMLKGPFGGIVLPEKVQQSQSWGHWIKHKQQGKERQWLVPFVIVPVDGDEMYQQQQGQESNW